MSIYIHGIDMPTKENTVILITPSGDVWMIGDMPNEDTHLAKAKAISIPPHGRCIDVDALEDNNITYYAIPVLKNVTDAAIREAELVIRLKDLDAAPTVIEAEEGK